MTRFPAAFAGLLRARPAWRLAIAALLAGGLLLLLNGGNELVVRMEIESAAEGAVAVYFDDGKGYREAASVSRPLRRGLHRYELPLGVERVNSFRIDPATHDQVTRIAAVEARSRGRLVKRFDAGALLPANDIAYSQVEDGGQSLRFTVRKGGSDPYFMVAASALEAPGASASWIAANLFTAVFAVLAVALVAGLGAGAPRDGNPPLLRYGIVSGLVLAMALIASTTHSVSPDEFSHLSAARYYLDNWMPSKIGEESTLGSYSVYGASYLNEPDVVYVLAAKFVVATEFLGLDETVRFRLFNVALLALCVLLAVQRRFTAWLTLPLLCTAQAWYVFAYFNADAVGIAVTTLLGASVLAYFDRVEERGGSHAQVDLKALLTIGVLLGLAFLCKKTFYPFIVFIAGYAAWRAGFRHRLGFALGFAGLFLLLAWHFSAAVSPSVPPMLPGPVRAILGAATLACLGAAAWLVVVRRNAPAPRTLIGAALVGVAIVALRMALDAAVNGPPWEHSRALTELTERLARADFRPSAMGTPQSYFGLALAAKGVTLWEMLFTRFGWVGNVNASFFGVYGYMNIIGPMWLYQAQYAVGLVLVAALAAAGLRDPGSRGATLLGIACIAFAIVLSMVYSWVRDLQAQGRYLLVVLPILGMMAAEAARVRAVEGMGLRVVRTAALVLFVLGVVSFAFVGIPGMARA